MLRPDLVEAVSCGTIPGPDKKDYRKDKERGVNREIDQADMPATDGAEAAAFYVQSAGESGQDDEQKHHRETGKDKRRCPQPDASQDEKTSHYLNPRKDDRDQIDHRRRQQSIVDDIEREPGRVCNLEHPGQDENPAHNDAQQPVDPVGFNGMTCVRVTIRRGKRQASAVIFIRVFHFRPPSVTGSPACRQTVQP